MKNRILADKSFQTKTKITAIVLTKNEEENIKACLQGLQWCDEIIVVDDYSTDNTRKIAKRLGARVFTRALNGDFAAQRNFGLKKAKEDWVLFIDADERVTEELANEARQVIQKEAYGKNCVNGFFLKRKDWFGGRWLKHGETGNVRLLRLARKDVGKWQRRVHETWKIKGKVEELKEPLLHYPHPTISKFLEQINFYTSLDASEFLREGKRVGLIQILAYPLGKFFQNYILRLGFLDGTPGIIVALMMSFHSFLTRAKLYMLVKKGGWWEL